MIHVSWFTNFCNPISKPHKKFFEYVFLQGFSFWQNSNKISNFNFILLILRNITIFLILPNVKILSPLERFKMKRAKLFSKNEDSTRISWKLWKLRNRVLFWSSLFAFIIFKVLSFQNFSALFSNFQRTVVKSTAQCFFISSALWKNFQCAEI